MNSPFFQFHSPLYFCLLILVVLLFVFDLKKLHLLKFPVSSIRLFSGTKRSWRSVLEFVPPFFRFVAMVLLVVALARPQWGNKYTEIESEGIDIVLALDTSGSMKALDLELHGTEVNRLEVIKSVVRDFIKGRKYDRIGMVVFGTEAYTQCPLTLDYDILTGYLDLIQIGIAGEDTAIGDAIATSVKRLLPSQAKSKVIVLLTDGENTAGSVSPLQAAEVAQKHGIKIYTIAVGTDRQAVPVPVETFYGVRKVPMRVSVDVETLKAIAEKTQGKFFQATDTEALVQIYKTIDQLEKTKAPVINQFSDYQEQYLTYLIPALVLLILSWLMQRTIFLRVP